MRHEEQDESDDRAWHRWPPAICVRTTAARIGNRMAEIGQWLKGSTGGRGYFPRPRQPRAAQGDVGENCRTAALGGHVARENYKCGYRCLTGEEKAISPAAWPAEINKHAVLLFCRRTV